MMDSNFVALQEGKLIISGKTDKFSLDLDGPVTKNDYQRVVKAFQEHGISSEPDYKELVLNLFWELQIAKVTESQIDQIPERV